MLVSVTPHQFTTTFSYILKELFIGMNYIITVRAGNILGESSPIMILGETEPTLSNLHNNGWFNVDNNSQVQEDHLHRLCFFH